MKNNKGEKFKMAEGRILCELKPIEASKIILPDQQDDGSVSVHTVDIIVVASARGSQYKEGDRVIVSLPPMPHQRISIGLHNKDKRIICYVFQEEQIMGVYED